MSCSPEDALLWTASCDMYLSMIVGAPARRGRELFAKLVMKSGQKRGSMSRKVHAEGRWSKEEREVLKT